MSDEKRHTPPLVGDRGTNVFLALRRSDQIVWKHLSELTQNTDTCTASIRGISTACNISERQVQISTGRLIAAGVIRRVGYDFGNPCRAKRGTVYKVLRSST